MVGIEEKKEEVSVWKKEKKFPYFRWLILQCFLFVIVVKKLRSKHLGRIITQAEGFSVATILGYDFF